MRQARDMSQKQFEDACRKHEIGKRRFMGYHDIGDGASVSVSNTGSKRRRTWLAYLLEQQERLSARNIRKILDAGKKDLQGETR